MHTNATQGPAFLSAAPDAALHAWESDPAQWILTDACPRVKPGAGSGTPSRGTRYLVGYAPGIFRDGPMAQGWRMTCPEALDARRAA